MLLAPIDGVWEAAHEYEYRVGIGLVELAHEILVGQLQRFAVYRLSAIAGHWAEKPVCLGAIGVVARADDDGIRLASHILCFAHAVVGDIVDFKALSVSHLLKGSQDGYLVGWGATIPIVNHLVGIGTYNRDFADFLAER